MNEELRSSGIICSRNKGPAFQRALRSLPNLINKRLQPRTANAQRMERGIRSAQPMNSRMESSTSVAVSCPLTCSKSWPLPRSCPRSGTHLWIPVPHMPHALIWRRHCLQISRSRPAPHRWGPRSERSPVRWHEAGISQYPRIQVPACGESEKTDVGRVRERATQSVQTPHEALAVHRCFSSLPRNF